MPRAGFKSITVSDEVYDHFHEQYFKIKHELLKNGISSYSGFITSLLYRSENEM